MISSTIELAPITYQLTAQSKSSNAEQRTTVHSKKNGSVWGRLTEPQHSHIEKNLIKKQAQQELLDYVNRDPATGRSRPTQDQDVKSQNLPTHYLKIEPLEGDYPSDDVIADLPYWYERNEQILSALTKGADFSRVGFDGSLAIPKDINNAAERHNKHFTALHDQLYMGYSTYRVSAADYKSQRNKFNQAQNCSYLGSALHKAIIDNDSARVNELLIQGSKAHIESRDSYGYTPLLKALKQQEPDIDIIETLLAHEANPNEKSYEFQIKDEVFIKLHSLSENCLQLVIQCPGYSPYALNILQLLINYGADPYQLVNHEQQHYPTIQKSYSELLDYANLIDRPLYQDILFQIIFGLKYSRLTHELLQQQTDLNEAYRRNPQQLSHLHLAASKGRLDCAKELLRWGMNPDLKNKVGKIALDIFKEKRGEDHPDVIEFERITTPQPKTLQTQCIFALRNGTFNQTNNESNSTDTENETNLSQPPVKGLVDPPSEFYKKVAALPLSNILKKHLKHPNTMLTWNF